MLLAVKLYRDVKDRPDHIPPQWPAEVREIKHGSECPEGWTLMTRETYEDYRKRHWIETKPTTTAAITPVPTIPPAVRPESFWGWIKWFLLKLIGGAR